MDEDRYERISAPFRKHPQATRLLRAANKALTAAGYVLYPTLLALIALDGDYALLLRCIVVPAAAFAAVTIIRRAINAARPYETLDIDPLIVKDTHGKSFPSRHTFSMFMIAMSWLAFCAPVGAALLAAGVAMAGVRVVGGVHYPRDVIAGAACALLAGAIGYAGCF